ncbi:hypothetical protein GGI43DRAFT_396513 [Trichoderma evansii]
MALRRLGVVPCMGGFLGYPTTLPTWDFLSLDFALIFLIECSLVGCKVPSVCIYGQYYY